MATLTTRKILQAKNHACDWPNCGKSFTRAEHLRRHALNHRQDDNICERCGVHFCRPDLLGRHMARHAKRDEEAGGPGLGVLETRKRTRRGPDGTIITWPTKKQARAMARKAKALTETAGEQLASTAPSASSSAESAFSDAGSQGSSNATTLTRPPISDLVDHDHDESLGAPISPPRSSSASCAHENIGPNGIETCQPVDDSDPLITPMAPQGHHESYAESIPVQSDAADGSWDTAQNRPLGMGYGGLSNFDRATPFNMPFVEAYDYNWLFNVFNVLSLDGAFSHSEIPLGPDSVDSGESAPDLWFHPFSFASHSRGYNPIDRGSSVNSTLNSLTACAGRYTLLHRYNCPFQNRMPTPPECSPSFPLPSPSSEDIPVEQQFPGVNWTNPYNQICSDSLSRLPRVGETARTGILSLVSQLQPLTLDGASIDVSSPLLSLGSLQNFCDLFFLKFNSSYPLIHQPTFHPDDIDTLLLASVLSMGATYSTDEAHQLAVGIHDSLRIHLFSHPDFSAQPELWLLQAAVLIDCFGMQRAGHKQRDMAQLFHCVLVKLIRRSDCLRIRTTSTVHRPKDIELAWRQEMEAEARKRLGMLCFAWDTQDALLFSRSLCMSAFEIRSSLPCDTASWEASTAGEWFEHSRREKPHCHFLSALKGYVTPGAMRRPRHLDVLARMFLLHGLISISSDLRRRDQTTLRSDTRKLVGAWKSCISRSYDLWKTDFETDCVDTKTNNTSDLGKPTALRAVCLTLYHAAKIVLDVEVVDLQIYAGVSHILGKEVRSLEFERSQRNVAKWLDEDPEAAFGATRHAAFILQNAMMSFHDSDMEVVFYYPWCLYLATLTCWTFYLRNNSRSASMPLKLDNDKAIKSNNQARPEINTLASRNEMATLLIEMTVCSTFEELSTLVGKVNPNELTVIMAQKLANVRWVVVQDAMRVLVQLSVSSSRRDGSHPTH